MLRFKKDHGATWELIFYHDYTAGDKFNDDLALLSNDEKRFSIIGLINENFRHNGYYEYLLEYPEVPGYIQWRQSIDIASTTSTQTSKDIGFIKLHADYPGFEGLSRSTEPAATTFDGTPGSYGYWYSVGAKVDYFGTQFPGPEYAGQRDGVHYCKLWIRVPPRYLYSPSLKRNTFSKSALVIMLLILS